MLTPVAKSLLVYASKEARAYSDELSDTISPMESIRIHVVPLWDDKKKVYESRFKLNGKSTPDLLSTDMTDRLMIGVDGKSTTEDFMKVSSSVNTAKKAWLPFVKKLQEKFPQAEGFYWNTDDEITVHDVRSHVLYNSQAMHDYLVITLTIDDRKINVTDVARKFVSECLVLPGSTFKMVPKMPMPTFVFGLPEEVQKQTRSKSK